MRKLLEFILNELIGQDFYEIEEKPEGEEHVEFLVKVSKEKLGIVIGKEGHTVKSIQDVLRVKAKTEGKSVYVKVEERQ